MVFKKGLFLELWSRRGGPFGCQFAPGIVFHLGLNPVDVASDQLQQGILIRGAAPIVDRDPTR